MVVYVAGHGVAQGGPTGDFYLLFADADGQGLDDAAVRDRVAVSSEWLGARLASVAARKQFVVLDTCHSGGAVADLGRPRAISGDQIRAIDRMKDRAGLFVLAGSSADAVSYEATRYRKGLLTYALLDGMRGAAVREAEMWDVSMLASHAADRVPLLARGLGGVQRPVVAVPNGGASFDIGRATSAVRDAIPLPVDRPVVLRTSFQDDVAFVDTLELGAAVDRALRDAAAPDDAPFVTVDAHQYADGVRVVGRYRREGAEIVVDLRVVRGERVVAAEVRGADAASVANAVVGVVVGSL